MQTNLTNSKAVLGPASDTAQKPPELKAKTIRFKLAWFLPAVLMVSCIGVGLFSLLFSLQGGVSAANSISADLRSSILQTISSKILNYFSSAERLSTAQATAWSSGLISTSNMNGYMDFLWNQLKNNKEVVVDQWLTLATGGVWGYYAVRPSETSDYQYKMWRTVGGNYTESIIDVNRTVLSVDDYEVNYDATSYSSYTIVDITNKNDIKWTPPYLWMDLVWLTNSVPAYNASNGLVGVCGSDITLGFLSVIIQEIINSVTKHVDIYLFDSTGLLLGTSNSSLPISTTVDGNLVMNTIDNVLFVTPISVFYKHLSSSNMKLEDISDYQTFYDSSSSLYISYTAIQIRNIKWILVMSIARKETLQPLDDNFKISIITSCIVLVVGCIFSSYVAFYILSSLAEITAQLKSLSKFKFQEVYAGKNNFKRVSRFDEIFDIQRSCNEMTTAFITSIQENKKLINGTETLALDTAGFKRSSKEVTKQ